MVTELIAKYIWLLRAVMDTGEAGITLGEISGRYERRFGETLARRTFANYRIGVEETFGVGIACDRSTNRYMIDSSIPCSKGARKRSADALRWSRFRQGTGFSRESWRRCLRGAGLQSNTASTAARLRNG